MEPEPATPRADPSTLAIRPQEGPQAEFLRSKADIALMGGAAGGGKRLPVDLLIPTPDGWTRNGDLQAGGLVFGEHGRPVRVLVAHPPVLSPACYRLTFDDGTEIDADAEHLWLTYSAAELASLTRRTDGYRERRRKERPSRGTGSRGAAFSAMMAERNASLGCAARKLPPGGTIRTTEEIYRTLRTKRSRSNHAIPCATALELPDADLPIDPYVLGVWLGDGHSSSGCVTTVDRGILDELAARGSRLSLIPSQGIVYRIEGMTKRLRALGVLGDKHVPQAYLRASKRQRLDLLRGLMDTDGTVARDSGSAEFTTTSQDLADAIYEIIVSLGWKVRAREGRARLDGRDCGPKWTLKWMPSQLVFLLPRKAVLQKTATRRTARFRYVVDCQFVAPKRMRCITVDNPSGLYLAGRSMVPTHNTYALLMEPLRHCRDNAGFGAVVFRRTYAQVTKEGSLRDTAELIYPGVGATGLKSGLEWRFPVGAKVTFAHMQHEQDRFQWDGAQIPLICFDQLEHFTQRQFFYMLARNRTTCGVVPYVRATCNPPGPEHWLRHLVDWWIDYDTGYPIPERAGLLRWFVVLNNEFHWADSATELQKRFGADCMPKSFTFVPALVTDNKILMEKNPEYVANLKALHKVDRERLLGGNWNVRETAGMFFRREWFPVVDAAPTMVSRVRYWDRAGTEAKDGFEVNASFTAGVLMGKDARGVYYVLDVVRFQGSPLEVERAIKNTASQDGHNVRVLLEQDPGQAGKAEALMQVRNLPGYDARVNPVRESKGTRARPYSAQAEAGNVLLVRAPWNEAFLREHEDFDGTAACVNDQVDAASGGFLTLATAATAGVW